MRPVAERLLRRAAAAAQEDGTARDGELVAPGVHQLDRAFHLVRAVGAGRDRHICHAVLLLVWVIGRAATTVVRSRARPHRDEPRRTTRHSVWLTPPIR